MILRIREWIIVVLVCCLTACYQEPPEPNTPISRDKLASILADTHLAEAMLTEISPGRKKDSLAQLYYEQIYAIHEVNAQEIEVSMKMYMENPYALDSLYTQVVEELNKGKDEHSTEPKGGERRD